MTKDLPIESMADEQVALLFAILDDSTREWRQYLGEVSDDALAWQFVPNGHSIGTILLHIADVEGYWLQEILRGKERSPEELERLLSEETDQGNGNWPSPPRHDFMWFHGQLDAVRERTKASLQMSRIHDLSQPTPRGNVLTLRWILSHVIQHDSYHGGQAVLLHEMYKHKIKQSESATVK